MTDKCRRRINGREEYITTEITQSKEDGQEGEGGPKNGKRLLGCERSWGFPSSSKGSLLPRMLGRPILCVFHPQNEPSPYQSPTFRPTLYKFIVMGPVRKTQPYNLSCLWENHDPTIGAVYGKTTTLQLELSMGKLLV